MEYFGLHKSDMVKAKKLKELGVKHTPRLAELGVSKEAFEKLFEDILDFDEDVVDGAGAEPGAGKGSGKRAGNAKK